MDVLSPSHQNCSARFKHTKEAYIRAIDMTRDPLGYDAPLQVRHSCPPRIARVVG